MLKSSNEKPCTSGSRAGFSPLDRGHSLQRLLLPPTEVDRSGEDVLFRPAGARFNIYPVYGRQGRKVEIQMIGQWPHFWKRRGVLLPGCQAMAEEEMG